MRMLVVALLFFAFSSLFGKAEAQTSTQLFNSYSTSRNFAAAFSTAADTTISNDPNTFTANVNSAMATVASAGGGIVHIPAPSSGNYLATDWIAIPSNVALYCDAGSTINFASLPNSRCAMAVNASIGAAVDQNVGIYGCNLDMQHSGSKFTPTPEATYRMGVQFVGVDGLILDHVTISNSRNWGFAGNRLHNFYGYEITLNSYTSDSQPGDPGNEGTFQFQGQNSHIKIRNLRGTTNDDMLAFVHGWINGPTMPPGDGPVTDADISGIFLNTDSSGYTAGLGTRIYTRDPLNGIRVETTGQLADQIRFSNIVGRVRNQLFEFGSDNYFDAPGNYGQGNNGTIIVDGALISTAVTGVSQPPQQIYPSVSFVNGNIDTLILRNVTIANTDRGSSPLWLTSYAKGSSGTGSVKNLILDNFATSSSWAEPILYVDSGATVQNLIVRNWGAQSSSYYVQNVGGTVGSVSVYGGSSWAGKYSGTPAPTYYSAGTPLSYTSTATQAAVSYPQNLAYHANGTLTWSAVTGATSYTVQHTYMYWDPAYNGGTGWYQPWPPTVNTVGTTSSISYTLPAYTAGQWHLFAVKANNQSQPSRPIYVQIGQDSATGQNLGYIEGVSVSGSGPYTVTGAMTQAATITAPAGATVSYPTANTFQFTTAGGEGAIWGNGPGGVIGPYQLLLPLSPATTTAKSTATMRASFR